MTACATSCIAEEGTPRIQAVEAMRMRVWNHGAKRGNVLPFSTEQRRATTSGFERRQVTPAARESSARN